MIEILFSFLPLRQTDNALNFNLSLSRLVFLPPLPLLPVLRLQTPIEPHSVLLVILTMTHCCPLVVISLAGTWTIIWRLLKTTRLVFDRICWEWDSCVRHCRCRLSPH